MAKAALSEAGKKGGRGRPTNSLTPSEGEAIEESHDAKENTRYTVMAKAAKEAGKKGGRAVRYGKSSSTPSEG